MKKLITFISAIALVCLLAGCGEGSAYQEAKELYESGQYQDAKSAFEELGDYEDSAEMAMACSYAEAEDYFSAADYESALAIYETIVDYEDSAGKISACYYAEAEELYKATDYEGAIAIYETISDYEDSQEMVSACKYAQAEILYNDSDYEGAISIYEEISDYEDSADRIVACKYAEAEQLYEAGDYENSVAMYEMITDYADSSEKISACRYAQAEELYNAGDYEAAIEIYETIIDYEDAASKVEDAEYEMMYSAYGDIIDLLDGVVLFYNGGSDVLLNTITFSARSATYQQVYYDGNGDHINATNECSYMVDDEQIVVEFEDGSQTLIPYQYGDGALDYEDGVYFTTDEVYEGLQGYWTYDDSGWGLEGAYNLLIDGYTYTVESATEGFNLPSGEYYYYGPYIGVYSIGLGALDFNSTNGDCYKWSFNIINGEVIPIHYDSVCSRGSGLPGQYGYNFE